MDSVYFAVAALVLIGAGVACLFLGLLTFAAAFVRWEVLPRIGPVVAVVAAHAREWLAPDPALDPRRL